MKKNNYNVIGVMSGTSLDGIDLVRVEFNFVNETWTYRLLEAETVPYSQDWKDRLKDALFLEDHQLEQCNQKYTRYLGETISSFIHLNKIKSIDAVCSHGHTIKHLPDKGITLQIGNLPELATIVGEKIVCDFRVQDVRMGGQGAPLVPVGDALLFKNFDYCLNLGGFANVSLGRAGKRMAFDICAVNTVLNFLAEKIGYDFDPKGSIAASGKLDSKLFNRLNALEYYRKPAPKSLGIEWVQQEIFPLVEAVKPVKDALRTFTEHIAVQIADTLSGKKAKVLVTGGGARNDFLIRKIEEKLETLMVKPEDRLIDFKEAVIFGFLGVLRLRGENNIWSSVTGASADHCSGKIFSPEII